MTKPDASALTSRVIASMGHNADILNGDTVDVAQNNRTGLPDRREVGFRRTSRTRNFSLISASVAMNAHNGLAGQQTNHDAMLGAMRQIYSAASNGAIDGPTYLALTQTGSALSNLQKSGKPLAQYANAARDALDDALQRAAPQESQQIQLLRNQYRNSVIFIPSKTRPLTRTASLIRRSSSMPSWATTAGRVRRARPRRTQEQCGHRHPRPLGETVPPATRDAYDVARSSRSRRNGRDRARSRRDGGLSAD